MGNNLGRLLGNKAICVGKEPTGVYQRLGRCSKRSLRRMPDADEEHQTGYIWNVGLADITWATPIQLTPNLSGLVELRTGGCHNIVSRSSEFIQDARSQPH